MGNGPFATLLRYLEGPAVTRKWEVASHLERGNSGPGMLARKENSGQKIYYPMSDSLEAEPEIEVLRQVIYGENALRRKRVRESE